MSLPREHSECFGCRAPTKSRLYNIKLRHHWCKQALLTAQASRKASPTIKATTCIVYISA
jgi:hypothetical protein